MAGGTYRRKDCLREREREPAGARRVANLPVSTHASAAGSVGRSVVDSSSFFLCEKLRQSV